MPDKNFDHLSTENYFARCLPRYSRSVLFMNNKWVKLVWDYIKLRPLNDFNMKLLRNICKGPIFPVTDLSDLTEIPPHPCKWRMTEK